MNDTLAQLDIQKNLRLLKKFNAYEGKNIMMKIISLLFSTK
jgi:hypothetical protein